MTPPLTLAERMAEALKGVDDIRNDGERYIAYLNHDAIDPCAFSGNDKASLMEYDAADAEALSTEIARRLGGANDPA
jgi:hypothetical protein